MINWTHPDTHNPDTPFGAIIDREGQGGIVYTVCLLTMVTGVGDLTGRNFDEFVARVNVYERLNGAIMRNADGPAPLTPERLLPFLGLKTNVFPQETRAAWLKRIVTAELSAAALAAQDARTAALQPA